MKRLLMTSLAALMLVPPLAAQSRRVILIRPAWGWYDPFWGPYPYAYGYYPAPSTGEVKFDTKVKDAAVFIDGAYAGTIDKLKKLDLRPGTYNIELRKGGEVKYAEKIYVVAGKTLHLKPDVNLQVQP